MRSTQYTYTISQNSNACTILFINCNFKILLCNVSSPHAPKTCSLQGIVHQTFSEKTVTGQQLHMLRRNWLQKYNTKTSINVAKTSEQKKGWKICKLLSHILFLSLSLSTPTPLFLFFFSPLLSRKVLYGEYCLVFMQTEKTEC